MIGSVGGKGVSMWGKKRRTISVTIVTGENWAKRPGRGKTVGSPPRKWDSDGMVGKRGKEGNPAGTSKWPEITKQPINTQWGEGRGKPDPGGKVAMGDFQSGRGRIR